MRQRALIGALLVVALGVILGATVFRTDIAQATGLAGPDVRVINTAAQAVPVREQNLSGGNIKVHEQGTVQISDNTSPGQDPFYAPGPDLTVPAGKRAIVTFVNASLQSASGAAALSCQLRSELSGGSLFVANIRLLPADSTRYIASEPVFIVVDAGRTLTASCTGAGFNENLATGGYFVPAP
jgi:hypothetical protein